MRHVVAIGAAAIVVLGACTSTARAVFGAPASVDRGNPER